MQNERVKSDLTIVVFKDQTHLTVFDNDLDSRKYVINHRDGMSYDDALKWSRDAAVARGMNFISEYSEFNEFGDPVTCLFFRLD